MLDEPFGALDPGIRADIHVLMKRLWNETNLTVVMVTHDMREAFTLGTRVIAFEPPRDRPDERERYGASLSRDIEIWPPRRAGRLQTDSPDRDDPILEAGTGGDDPALLPQGEPA
jgi:NitT/TauT family transport system ATP-binding protein